jgi:hypothetical protein
MSRFEGFISLSSLERRAASRYYLFNFVNVFLGSIITGSAFEQLDSFIHQSANEYVILKDVLFPLLFSMYVFGNANIFACVGSWCSIDFVYACLSIWILIGLRCIH